MSDRPEDADAGVEARVLTSAGRRAIAVVEVAGPEALSRVAERFTPAGGTPLAETRLNAIRFGLWRHDASSVGEEVVVVRTGSDRLEVHCHGGVAASAALVASLGVEPNRDEPGNGEPTSETLEADALRLLREAPTERVAGLLLDQAAGALRVEVESILDAIEADRVTEVGERIEDLLRYRRVATDALRRRRVVLAGPPNVGKSSLINALLGYDRAITYDRPGTTRDVLTAETAIAGWPVTLSDTAGVREADDPLERAGVELARDAIAAADVVLVVGEAADWPTVASRESRQRVRDLAAEGARVIDVASKADLVGEPAAAEWRPSRTNGTTVATRFVDGQIDLACVAGLVAALEAALAIATPPVGGAAPFRAWHVNRLLTVRERIAAGEDATPAVRSLLAPR